MKTIIATSQRMTCKCGRLLGFGLPVTSEDIPVELLCEKCGHSFVVSSPEEAERYSKLRKFPVERKNDGLWMMIRKSETPMSVHQGDEGKEPEQVVQEEVGKIPKQAATPSFVELVKDMSATGLSFMHQAKHIESLVQQLADSMGDDMRRELEVANSVASWNYQLLYSFIRNPFSKIQANCLDSAIEPYSGFILCPKFYPNLHGFPISCKGGYYLQAVTPYSQIAFPLETRIAETLSIEPAVDARILGGKIIGPGIVHHWKDIPGTEPDYDHNANNPSLVVVNWLAARKWLAKHGAKPWPVINIKEEFYPYYSGMIKSDCDVEAIAGFYETLSCTGRVALCWQNFVLSRVAASVAGHGMRGIKVIWSDSDERPDWHGGFSMEFADKKQFVYMRTDEVSKVRVLNHVSLMIVDTIDSMPPLEFWDWLHGYTGALVIILKDPMLDTFEENEYAEAVYSLVNHVSIMPDDATWRNAWKQYETSPPEAIQRTLTALKFM